MPEAKAYDAMRRDVMRCDAMERGRRDVSALCQDRRVRAVPIRACVSYLVEIRAVSATCPRPPYSIQRLGFLAFAAVDRAADIFLFS